MKANLPKFIFILLFTLFYAAGNAQELIVMNAFSEGKKDERLQNVHKMIESSFKLRFLSVTLDNKKPYEMQVAIGDENTSINLDLHKNNTFSLEIIDLEDTDIAELKLIDNKGSVVKDKKISKSGTDFSLNKCNSGTYYLEVFVNNRLKKQYNITKR